MRTTLLRASGPPGACNLLGRLARGISQLRKGYLDKPDCFKGWSFGQRKIHLHVLELKIQPSAYPQKVGLTSTIYLKLEVCRSLFKCLRSHHSHVLFLMSYVFLSRPEAAVLCVPFTPRSCRVWPLKVCFRQVWLEPYCRAPIFTDPVLWFLVRPVVAVSLAGKSKRTGDHVVAPGLSPSREVYRIREQWECFDSVESWTPSHYFIQRPAFADSEFFTTIQYKIWVCV
jgi:hypothetical protein